MTNEALLEIIKSLSGFSSIPVISALVALLKTTVPTFPARYYPTAAVFFGIVINIAIAYYLGLAYDVSIFIGFLCGLSAAGLFQYGKEQEIKNEQRRNPRS